MKRDRRLTVEVQNMDVRGNPDLLAAKVDNEKSPQLVLYEQALREEISGLNGRQGQIMKMYMRGDFSVREIARKLRISPSSVQTYLDRGIESLKKRLAAKGIA